MDLSPERKRQIRAEEEAKFRAEQEAEQQYREQVRRELDGQRQAELEEQYRESVRAKLTGTPPPQQESDSVPVPTATAPAEPALRRSAAHRFMNRVLAVILILGGLTCAGFALSRGFNLPFTGPPVEITLKADGPGELEVVGEEVVFEETSTLATSSTAKVATPSRTKPAAKAAKEPAPTRPSTTLKPTGKRATLPSTNTSIEVPPGWAVESADYDDVLEIRWHGSEGISGHREIVAYLLLQTVDLQRREDLEDFGERMMEQFQSSVSPDQNISYEREKVIKNFHGVTALSIDIVERGFLPYRMRNFFWIKGGKGYMLSCYATAGSFEDRAPAFKQMLDSIRFSREER